ncbi:hypothetical protein BH10PSE9_BH10PSE9_14240 [soil metagenome]
MFLMNVKLGLVGIAIVLALSGCNLGGGGAAIFAANGLIASRTGDVNSNTVTVSPTSQTTFSAVTNSDESIDASWNNGPLSGQTRKFSKIGPGQYGFSNDSEEGVLAISQATTYTAIGVGAVRTKSNDVVAVGLFHSGVAPTAIPASGTLQYGMTNGLIGGTDVPGSVGVVGDVSIAANFSNGQVTGTFSNVKSNQTSGGPTSMQDIGFTGTMATGKALYSSNAMTYGGTAVATGQLVGGFYGPGAVDTAGVFDMTAASSGPRIIGAYGATSAP